MFLELELKDKNKVAIVDDNGVSLTYGNIIEYSKKLSNILSKRELAFIFCDNSAANFLSYYASYENGTVSLLLSDDIDKDQLTYLIAKYKPSLFIVPNHMISNFKKDTNFDMIVGSFMHFSILKTKNEKPILYHNLSFLLSTSGSTGSPKLVRHKYGNLESSAKNVCNSLGIKDTDTALGQLPFQYTMGLSVINSHLYAGATVLLVKSPVTTQAFWEFIMNNNVTTITGVPYTFEIFRKLRFTNMNLDSLRILSNGGGKLSDDLYEYLLEYCNSRNLILLSTYGTTECTARMAYLPPKYMNQKKGSIGYPIQGGNLYLVNDSNNKISTPYEHGELIYQGPNVTMGYGDCLDDLMLGDEFNGVYSTGDIAYTDLDGAYYIVGRKKRFIKLFGVRYSLDDLERVLKSDSGIQCGIIGNDQQIYLFIEEKMNKEEIELMFFSKFKIPKQYLTLVIIKAIPRHSNGKIDYQKLTDLVSTI